MSARKPPRLANWLLNRSGFARQNPPLAGDLLEEFRSGRSAAWFWRQTLVFIFKGLGRNVRVFWQTWTGILGGWGAQTVIAFTLWRSHFPPQLPAIFGAIAAAACSISLARSLWRRFRRKADGQLPTEETAEAEEAEDQPSWIDLVASFSVSFTAPLLGYCISALLWVMTGWMFVVLQTEFLLIVVRALKPDSDPGPVKTS